MPKLRVSALPTLVILLLASLPSLSPSGSILPHGKPALLPLLPPLLDRLERLFLPLGPLLGLLCPDILRNLLRLPRRLPLLREETPRSSSCPTKSFLSPSACGGRLSPSRSTSREASGTGAPPTAVSGRPAGFRREPGCRRQDSGRDRRSPPAGHRERRLACEALPRGDVVGIFASPPHFLVKQQIFLLKPAHLNREEEPFLLR